MNIRQASGYTGISKDMIRFYESKGLIKPARKENGYRDYSNHDLLLLVMIRQYSCLGMELKEIAKLLHHQDETMFAQSLGTSAERLKHEREWIDAKIDFAENLNQIFDMASKSIEYAVIPHSVFWFYPRIDIQQFADYYALELARPVLRIRKDVLGLEDYPEEQGMMFPKEVDDKSSREQFSEGTYIRFIKRVSPESGINHELIQTLTKRIRELGYTITGDCLVFLVMGDTQQQLKDLVCFDFEIGKRTSN